MAQFHQKRTYNSYFDIETETLFEGLLIVKKRLSDLDLEQEDISLAGSLIIDLYEISEEIEKRLLLV